MIKLLIADDHPVVRNALAQLLGDLEDVELVGTARNGREAIALAGETAPDVVLMDLEMPELDGIAATELLKRSGVDAQVVILTTFSDHRRIVAALDAGALGYRSRMLSRRRSFGACASPPGAMRRSLRKRRARY